MTSVASSSCAPSSSPAFTVLIPRGLQATVEGLAAETRQELLAELFRLAALARQEESHLPPEFPYTLRLDVAGCQVSVELDPSRARLTLVGLLRPQPLE
ncbi:hypothetical protein HV824_14920 [Myxococcus sp. AM009]|uniref:hypothetical protein n=1 Tax=unclassified Myxococcus TaxID=2648731 RepID=UPI0015951CAA|nr:MULTISPECIES: hypothetical protein [unclassified Myxococcus]NVI99405.1 hypothetical protein [Myxococcus sp. AM009]NVJ15958.1 hypothetical protein [Myxococcus sp. AM010]